jgi:hypothetical protein
MEQCWEEKSVLYEKYKKWCLDGSYSPLSRAKFNSRLVELCPSVKEYKGTGARKWRGISFTE